MTSGISMKSMVALVFALGICGCTGMPGSVKPVQDFQLDRYLGQWYEVARLDHSFEAGLVNVTATYRLREGGGVSVLNRGFSPEKNEWKEAQGKAFFVDSPDEGYLKVSFFGPFYGSYIVFGLDQQDYQYAFVSGPNLSYLWLLSRTPEVTPEIKTKFIKVSQALGFDTNALIWVKQQPSPND